VLLCHDRLIVYPQDAGEAVEAGGPVEAVE